jgi:hypothetical protein
MITEAEVMPLLLAACPGFAPTWQEHLAWWEGDERGSYNDAAEFARYLVESYNRGDTSEFELAFATIERLIDEGDENTRGLVIVGVLEGIQTIASHSCGPDALVRWLGPKSHAAWVDIAQAWSGKTRTCFVPNAARPNRWPNKSLDRSHGKRLSHQA